MTGLTFTYNTLVEAIGQYTLEGVSAVQNGVTLNNGDFQAALPTIISLAEERIIRDLNTSVFDVELNATLTTAVPYIPIPSDYLGIRSLSVATDSVTFIPIKRHDITWLENYWRNPSNLGVPLFYAVWGNDGNGIGSGSIKVAPTPDAFYPYTLRYIQRPATISPTNPSTWLSTHAADCLLWVCLAESMAYLREDIQSENGMTQMFEGKYQSELVKLKKELSNLLITSQYY